MDRKNGITVNIDIDDRNFPKDAAPDQMIEAGTANIDITVDGNKAEKKYRILLRKDFFDKPEENPEATETPSFVEDIFVRISKVVTENRLETVITVETDPGKLLEEDAEKTTFAAIEPAGPNASEHEERK